ncbi:MAG: DUF2066 domain-containing protein [Gammaproteobacteria bacterium]|jgi:hypothetical protein|nr:DUF2066 domain-containing protein [Gammaproteobacteria bacterium]
MSSLHLTLRALFFLWFAAQIQIVAAERVTDLYAAQVPNEDGVMRGPSGSFAQALRNVLVKVTGQRGITADPVIMNQFTSADQFVEQFRSNPDGSLWVLFDQVALRRSLDGIGQPVWGEERPLTLVWMVMDYGTGSRDILAADSDLERETGLFTTPLPPGGAEQQMAVREILQTTAVERGLPLILPLVDFEELSSVSISDVWGGFTESLLLASERYGVDAILVGRARVIFPGSLQVRWTLLLGQERFDWDGDIASGPDRIADFFASRLATSSRAAGRMQLRIDGVNSLDDYGRLSRYLSALDVIENYSVEQITDQTIIFSVLVRGDADRLMRSIALRHILQPVNDSQGFVMPRMSPDDPFGSMTSSLHYALLAGP